MSDLLDFINARLAEDELLAHALGGEGWNAHEPAHGMRRVTVNYSTECVVACTLSARGEHIALHDPARELREVEAKRLLIDDITAERHLVVEDDCWFTCPAATEDRDGGESCNDNAGNECNCGRDARVERRLRLLALPFDQHPDYREDWRPRT